MAISAPAGKHRIRVRTPHSTLRLHLYSNRHVGPHPPRDHTCTVRAAARARIHRDRTWYLAPDVEHRGIAPCNANNDRGCCMSAAVAIRLVCPACEERARSELDVVERYADTPGTRRMAANVRETACATAGYGVRGVSATCSCRAKYDDERR